MGIIKVTMTTSFLTTPSMLAEHVGTQILSRKYFFLVIYKYIDTDIFRDIYIINSIDICMYTCIVIIFLTKERPKVP